MSLLTPKKLGVRIKSLRKRSHVSQEDLAKSLGVPRQSISQIENGGRGLDSLELAKIARFFSMPTDTFLFQQIEQKSHAPKNKNGGQIKLNSAKLRNLFLYILEKCGGKPNLGETVLYKLLYFIDFDSYEIYGKPVTGMKYIRLQFGPVPRLADFQSVIESMIKKGEICLITQDYHGMVQKRYIALVEAEVGQLSKEELQVADKVMARLSDMSATKIENYVHEDEPWKAAEPNKEIDYNLVYFRSPAYAQSDYVSMMQNAAGADILKALGDISDEEVQYYEGLK